MEYIPGDDTEKKEGAQDKSIPQDRLATHLEQMP